MTQMRTNTSKIISDVITNTFICPKLFDFYLDLTLVWTFYPKEQRVARIYLTFEENVIAGTARGTAVDGYIILEHWRHRSLGTDVQMLGTDT